MKTKKERILENINNNKELQKKMPAHMDSEDFYNNALRYISAIKEGRMLCNIASVSNSGMSRTLRFMECSGSKKRFRYYNFYSLFLALGFSHVNNTDNFRIGGCGMNMVFHTNYTIIHRLERLGFISRKECDILAQNTPSII